MRCKKEVRRLSDPAAQTHVTERAVDRHAASDATHTRLDCNFHLLPIPCQRLMPKIPTMHRALDMPEIVSIICGFAASEWKDCRTHHYCHSLALTCRRFREPALDVLWETLGNMAVLLKCFPSDVWIEERRNPESHWYRATVLVRLALVAQRAGLTCR